MTLNDPNAQKRNELIREIHRSKTELVLALSGGGSLILGDLLTVPGGSKTVIEASIPYSEESVREYIGRVPDQYCCQRTARYLAMAAFHRGMKNIQERLHPNAMPNGASLRCNGVDVSHDPASSSSADSSSLDASDRILAAAEDKKTGRMSPIDSMDLDHYFHLIGIGCTASLITDREKRGEYRVHIAAQTLRRTQIFSLRLTKGARNRFEEERLLADLILNVIETARREIFAMNHSIWQTAAPPVSSSLAVGFDDLGWNTFGQGTTDEFPIYEALSLSLKDDEKIQGRQTVGSPPLVDLFFGRTWAVLWRNGEIQHFRLRDELPSPQPLVFNSQAELMQAVFPGSFNPIHRGHVEMIDIAERKLGNRVALEISVQNVDKPSLDYIELENRLSEIGRARPGQAVWLTQTPLFEEKSRLFREATFVVGADTLRRFAELRFYHESIHQLHDVLRIIGYHDCRFLVFSRIGADDRRETLRTLDIPDMLRSLSDEIPETEFSMNISSREMRRNEF